MMIRDAVDRGGGDEDEAPHAMSECGLQQQLGTLHGGREDLRGRSEWQCGGRMHHDVDSAHGALDGGGVTHVAVDHLDPRALRVLEGCDIQRAHALAALKQIAARD